MTETPAGFFITGGTMPRDAASYVERKADRQLLDALRQSEFCYVLTSRQMGKSSLMVRAAARLAAEGTAVAVLDLTGIGQNISVEQWYRGLSNRIGRHLGVEDEMERFWIEREDLNPLSRWMSALREVVLYWRTGRIAVFIDEIDVVRGLPFCTDEFFAGIRSIYNRRADDKEWERLTFCLLGVASPWDLIRDSRMTPFNIGRRIQLEDFTATEAAVLARGLDRVGHGVALVQQVLYWTGGHPYLTQKLCRTLVERAGRESVQEICHSLFFAHRAWEQDENLLFVREQVLRSREDPTDLLEHYRRIQAGKRVIDDETDPRVSVLRLSGIVCSTGGSLQVRNRIYARVFNAKWVTANLPNAELRRQRLAYRRGVLRASTVLGGMILCMLFLAGWAVMERNRSVRVEQRTARSLYAADLSLIAQALREHQLQRANELLVAHRQDPWRGFEWDYLRAVSHQEQFAIPASGPLATGVVWAPSGRLLAICGTGNRVELIDPAAKRVVGELASDEAVNSVAFDAAGNTVVGGTTGGSLILWDVATCAKLSTVKAHSGPVRQVVWGSRSGQISTLGEDHQVICWTWTRAAGMTRNWAKSVPRATVLGLVARRGWLVVGVEEGHVVFLDVGSGRTLARVPTISSPILSVATDSGPNGDLIAVGALSGSIALCRFPARGRDGTASLVHRSVRTFYTHRVDEVYGQHRSVTALAFSRRGSLLAEGSTDHGLRIWNLSSGALLQDLPAHDATVVSLGTSPDGFSLASAAWDGLTKVWSWSDLPRGCGPTVVRIQGTASGLRLGTVSGDGRWIAGVGYDGPARFWSAETGRQSGPIGVPGREIVSLEFSPNSRALTITDERGEITTVDVRSRRVTHKRRIPGSGASAAAVSWADGSLALARTPQLVGNGSPALQNTVTLWREGRELEQMVGHTGPVLAVALSSGGQVASSSRDRTIRVWATRRDEGTRVLRGHLKESWALAFDWPGERLLTGSNDGTVRLWDVAAGREVLVLRTGEGRVVGTGFARDGQSVYAVMRDGRLLRWSATRAK